MRRWRTQLLILILGLVICALPLREKFRLLMAGTRMPVGEKSVADRVAVFRGAVHGRLIARFREIGISYPPKNMVLVALKQERLLEVWVNDETTRYRYLTTYPILGASGKLGPKLREGDLQVPEGLYKIESLNPNSRFHLALRVNYPNDFDRERGRHDNRINLGSDIMIHGGTASVGCLAMGDEAAEDLFVLAAETGIKNLEVILAPVDFRVRELPADIQELPNWSAELYGRIRQSLMAVKKEPTP